MLSTNKSIQYFKYKHVKHKTFLESRFIIHSLLLSVTLVSENSPFEYSFRLDIQTTRYQLNTGLFIDS